MVKDNKILGISTITIFHQNICGLRKKINKLKSTMDPNLPHILCFSEHHLKNFELNQINISGYNLGAAYCRQDVKRGGVCIYVHNTLNYTNIDLRVHCKEQDIEVCALNLELIPSNIKIMTIYRALTGNFEIFLKKLDTILSTLYKTDLKLIICGDISINYLVDSEKKKKLDAVLLSYNLSAITDFPTRSQFQTSTIIDNIFIDTYKFTNYTVHPLYNGLSDHDAQLLKINEINLKQQNQPPGTIRNINKFSIEDFKIRLSYESWNSIFDNNTGLRPKNFFN